jgi:peptidoglycan-N-acetylglucosamine deacetylase
MVRVTKGTKHRALLAMAAAAALVLPNHPAHAEILARQPLHAACFTTAALAARPEERAPQRLPTRNSLKPPEAGTAQAGPLPQDRRGAIRRVDLAPGSRKLVALTLDFCEQTHEIAGYDGAIVDTLRRERVPATLFMGGKWMLSHEARTQQLISDPLFEIASHGWVHRNVRGLTGADLTREITAPSGAYRVVRASLAEMQCAKPQAAALSTIPQQLKLTRFAFGACNAESLRVANDAGLMAIQWDVSTGDPSPATSARQIVDTIVRNTRPGSIILAHANGRGVNTAAAMPAAIKLLRERGFEFVTVSALLAAGKPVVVDTCYDARPGDTDKYDRFFLR